MHLIAHSIGVYNIKWMSADCSQGKTGSSATSNLIWPSSTAKGRSLMILYSWTWLIWTWLFWIPRYFELKTISLGSLLQSFTISYFELPLFRTIFCSPCKFKIAGFNCIPVYIGEESWSYTQSILINLLLNERDGWTGEYCPMVVEVRTEHTVPAPYRTGCRLLNHWCQNDAKSAARCRLLNHWRQRLLNHWPRKPGCKVVSFSKERNGRK